MIFFRIIIKMVKLLIATANLGKLREIEEIFTTVSGSPRPFELVFPAQIGLSLDVVEDGKTYAENAAQKAQAYCRQSGIPALGDDSGLEVEALDGQPGLHSARYAPWPNATAADRRGYLLKQLQHIPRPWTARFRCTIVLALPDGSLFQAEGDCLGEIIPEERGAGGFGYDPIFYLPSLGQTMAELPQELKNRISHRAVAIRAALPILRQVLL
jgi:XTP/dITP diphosphohydrolase